MNYCPTLKKYLNYHPRNFNPQKKFIDSKKLKKIRDKLR